MALPQHYKTSHKVRIPASELELGMYVAELDRPWEETPFLFQGFTVRSEDDIRTVQAHCRHVVVDRLKYVRIDRRPREEKKKRRPRTRYRGRADFSPPPVEEALEQAEKTFDESNRLVRGIMDDVRLGKAIDTPAAREVVSTCVDNILENPDAMTLLTRIRQKDEYTSEHSLSVAVLSISLGRALGLDRERLNELGLCGMLHDIGKIMTPDEVLKKPGRLTPEEMEVMKAHPVQGRDILLSTDGVTATALDVAHAHHERVDGSGYPRGLTVDQMTLYTRIVAVTDTFDAITSDRVYDTGRTNIEAFKILTQGSGRQWDGNLVTRFIRTIGIYPPGALVELSDGRLALVLESNPRYQLRPKVLLIPADGRSMDRATVLDLETTLQDAQGEPLTIVRVLRPRDVGVDLHALRQNGLFRSLLEDL